MLIGVFLEEVLELKNFMEKWIQWIGFRGCICKFSVFINGRPRGRI